MERQVSVGRIKIDLLLSDGFGDTLIVELKRGTIRRENVGWIARVA